MIGARHLPGGLATALISALLALFIAYPIGAILAESFVVAGPMLPKRLKAVTEEALSLLPPERREAALQRWTAGASEKERVEALAAAFALTDGDAPWDRKAAFSEQSAAAESALAALAPGERAAVEAEVPIAVAMLHKRVALAFQTREALGPERFDALRTGTDNRWGLDHYLKPIEDRHIRRAALNSLALAACASICVTALAFLLSFGLNRGGVPRPGLMRAVLLLPLVAPPVLVATATIMLFGRRGLVTHTLLDRTLGLVDADVTNLYGFSGVVLAQTLCFLPAALIVIDNVLRKQDGRAEEAALSLGASRTQVFWNVTLPLAWPGLKRALVLVSILSLTDFGNPLLLGRDTPVIAGLIYDEITAFRNTPLAAALCVWLLAPSLLLYLALEALGGRKRYVTAQGTGGASEWPLPRLWRVGLGSLAGLVAGLVVAVYATVILGAFTRLWGVEWTPTLGYFTLQGVGIGHAGTGYGSSDRGLSLVWQSLQVAALAAPLGGLLGVVIAYVVERIRPPGANLIAFLALVPAILPGIIFGVGYIVAFNVPFGIKALSLTGTSAILVLNILFSNLFVGVLAARAALQRLDSSVDEAAESLGAGLVQRFFLVTLPMLRQAFLLGTLYVFVDGLTTLSSVIFLVSGEHKLASIAIFNHAQSGEFGYAAAKSVAILGAASLAMTMIWILERQGRTRITGAARGKLRREEPTLDVTLPARAAGA